MGKGRTFAYEVHDTEDEVSGQSVCLELGLPELPHFLTRRCLKEDGQVHKKGQNKQTAAPRAQTLKDGSEEVMEDHFGWCSFKHASICDCAGVYTKDKNEMHC